MKLDMGVLQGRWQVPGTACARANNALHTVRSNEKRGLRRKNGDNILNSGLVVTIGFV